MRSSKILNRADSEHSHFPMTQNSGGVGVSGAVSRFSTDIDNIIFVRKVFQVALIYRSIPL